MRSLTKLLPRFAFSLAKQVNLYKPLSIPLFNSILMKPQMNFSAHKNVIKSSYNGDGFYVEQMLTGCLAIYSYYIESNGEAIIIDPQNDISSYNEILAERKAKLKGVFMTHYHADYVAGHKQLAKVHKCLIYMGPKALEQQGAKVLKDGQHIKLGSIDLELLHTPGHTEESSCLLVRNKSGKQDVVFSGDTVFLNQVGRPDLAVKSNLTAKDLAQLLFDSIQKFKKINDNVRIYPGHGSGSSCGKAIGAGDFCDVGTQKKNNYALKNDSKQSFVEQVLKQMPNPPAYFGYNARLNKFEQFDYKQAYDKACKNLSVDQFNKLRAEGTLIIDVRDIPQLKTGIISGALCIAFNGGAFATWVGTLVSPKRQIAIYGDENLVTESIKRLLRIGYTNIRGYAKFPMDQWKSKNLPNYTPQFVDSVFIEGRTVLDVRKPQEWKSTGIADAKDVVTYTLTDVLSEPAKLDNTKKYVIHCRGGYRARIAYSCLQPLGYNVVVFPHQVQKIQKFKKYE